MPVPRSTNPRRCRNSSSYIPSRMWRIGVRRFPALPDVEGTSEKGHIDSMCVAAAFLRNPYTNAGFEIALLRCNTDMPPHWAAAAYLGESASMGQGQVRSGVHDQHFSGDVPRGGRAEEYHGVGDVIGLSRTLEWCCSRLFGVDAFEGFLAEAIL